MGALLLGGDEPEGGSRAGVNTSRLPFTEVALEGLSLMKGKGPEGAGEHTVPTTDAKLFFHYDGTGFRGPSYGLGGTGLKAGGRKTVAAIDHACERFSREHKETGGHLFFFHDRLEEGSAGKMGQGAGKLAGVTGKTPCGLKG